MSAFLLAGGAMLNLVHVTAATKQGTGIRVLLRGEVAFIDLDLTMEEFTELLLEASQ